MKIEEAKVILDEVCNVPFGELFKNHPNDLITNKGKVGQLLLIYIGIGLDSNLCDFEDGELKTNKSDKHGHPLETMFITQISAIIDELVIQPPKEFESSNLFIKIKNLIYLPVVKESENCSWFVAVVAVFLCDLKIRLHGTALGRRSVRSRYPPSASHWMEANTPS